MSVLSFRQSVNQLDQAAEMETRQRLASYCIQTTAEYAVELKAEDARSLRKSLERLAEQAKRASNSADAERIQDGFRSELRSYRHTAHIEIARLRTEVSAMIESMQAFMTNVGGSSHTLQQTLRQEFESLESTAESGDLDSIRHAIHRASEAALRSCEEFQRAQESVTAQLQDEIRNLHKLVDQERKASFSDPVTGIWNRAKLDSRIKDLILLNEEFCVFLVGLPRLNHAARSDARIAQEVLKALVGRLHSISGLEGELGMAGRWSEEIFAVVFNLPLSGTPTTPAAMQQSVGGAYSIQLDRECIEVPVSVQVQAVERPKDSGETAFYLHLGQAAFNVISA